MDKKRKIPRSKRQKYTNNQNRVIPLKKTHQKDKWSSKIKQILVDVRNISKILEPIIRSPKRVHMMQCNYAVFTIVISNTGRYILELLEQKIT